MVKLGNWRYWQLNGRRPADRLRLRPGVVLGYPHDPLSQLLANRRTTGLALVLECPLALHQFLMPVQDCRWFDTRSAPSVNVTWRAKHRFAPTGALV